MGKEKVSKATIISSVTTLSELKVNLLAFKNIYFNCVVQFSPVLVQRWSLPSDVTNFPYLGYVLTPEPDPFSDDNCEMWLKVPKIQVSGHLIKDYFQTNCSRSWMSVCVQDES